MKTESNHRNQRNNQLIQTLKHLIINRILGIKSENYLLIMSEVIRDLCKSLKIQKTYYKTQRKCLTQSKH